MTDMGNKVLVSVAPVAATDKVIIPEKIAEDVYDCYKAGAAMVLSLIHILEDIQVSRLSGWMRRCAGKQLGRAGA